MRPGRAERRGARRSKRRCRCRRRSQRRRELRGWGTRRSGSWHPPGVDLITLRADGAGLVLGPGVGVSIARYWVDGGTAPLDVLRPWLEPRQGDHFEAAAFPLVPYSNRIRTGLFSSQGRDVALALNRPPERHSIHGHGGQASWRPVDVQAREAGVEFRSPAAAGPRVFLTTQP